MGSQESGSHTQVSEIFQGEQTDFSFGWEKETNRFFLGGGHVMFSGGNSDSVFIIRTVNVRLYPPSLQIRK